jgi:hypothetical protein
VITYRYTSTGIVGFGEVRRNHRVCELQKPRDSVTWSTSDSIGRRWSERRYPSPARSSVAHDAHWTFMSAPGPAAGFPRPRKGGRGHSEEGTAVQQSRRVEHKRSVGPLPKCPCGALGACAKVPCEEAIRSGSESAHVVDA